MSEREIYITYNKSINRIRLIISHATINDQFVFDVDKEEAEELLKKIKIALLSLEGLGNHDWRKDFKVVVDYLFYYSRYSVHCG